MINPYFTGTSEKVVTTILLARICCHIVAPITVTYILVAQFVHGNTNKSVSMVLTWNSMGIAVKI